MSAVERGRSAAYNSRDRERGKEMRHESRDEGEPPVSTPPPPPRKGRHDINEHAYFREEETKFDNVLKGSLRQLLTVKLHLWVKSFRPSASVWGRTYTFKLAARFLPARYEAGVRGQGISSWTGVLPAEKRFELCNVILLQNCT